MRARLLIALLCAQERGEIHDAQAWVDACDIKRNPDTCVVEVTRERPLMVKNPGWAVWFARGQALMRDEDWQTFLWRLTQAVRSAESRGSQDTEALDGDFGAWRRVAEHLRAAQDEMVHRPEAAWDRGLGMVPLEPLPAADGRSGWSPPETRWSLTRNGGLSSVEMLVSAKHSSVRVGGVVVVHKPELPETLTEAMCWATAIAVAECRKYVRDREHDTRRRVQLVRAGYASIADEIEAAQA